MLKGLFSKGGASTEGAATPEQADPARPRNYTVGLFLQKDKTSIIYDAPKVVRQEITKNSSAKSVTQCPAVLDFDKRYFVVNSPIDLHMHWEVKDGKRNIVNMLWEKSPIRPEALAQMVVIQPHEEWRHPERPVLQMLTPYIFVSDDPVYINQLPPFLNYGPNFRPGVQINGRFPIDIWPRALQWAFEWHDISKDLILKRGEPLFYVTFEGPDPSASVRLIEAKKTPELETYVSSITGVTEWVTQTYSLFKTARERRPARLLYPKD
jgi:hypothetical protein